MKFWRWMAANLIHWQISWPVRHRHQVNLKGLRRRETKRIPKSKQDHLFASSLGYDELWKEAIKWNWCVHEWCLELVLNLCLRDFCVSNKLLAGVKVYKLCKWLFAFWAMSLWGQKYIMCLYLIYCHVLRVSCLILLACLCHSCLLLSFRLQQLPTNCHIIVIVTVHM